jgi:Ni,Fe-hydrogenase III large subunit
MRIKEIHSSMLILEQAILGIPPDKELKSDKKAILRKKSHGIGITEGWRGDIVYLVVTDLAGKVNRVDVRDPSFINWTILEHSINNEIIPDFPLINKSFNLSYSGNDL